MVWRIDNDAAADAGINGRWRQNISRGSDMTLPYKMY